MPRILLVHPDVAWCFKWMAEEIARYSGPDNYVIAMGQQDFEAVVKHAGSKSLGHLDAAFHFSLGSASILRRVNADRYGSLAANEGWCYDEYNPGNWRTNAVAPERNAIFGKDCAANLDCIICLTPRLHETISQWNENAVCIPQGLDTRLWVPPAKVRPNQQLRNLAVGWCGDVGAGRSFKGYTEVLQPLQQRSIAGVTWHINNRDYKSAKTRVEMRNWYGNLDVFVCTAINEGGPYPPFEAAACGCAVVSTDVGIVSDWQQLRGLGLIAPAPVNKRAAPAAIDGLAQRIEKLRDDPIFRETAGNTLRNSVLTDYNWETLTPRWLKAMLGC